MKPGLPCKAQKRNAEQSIRERAYTLVEILVVCAIIGIMCTLAIPMVYHRLHPDSMRKATDDISEACTLARATAILNGAPMDMVISVEDDLSLRVNIQNAAGMTTSSMREDTDSDADAPLSSKPVSGGAPSFSARVSNMIAVELLEVNFQDAMDWAEVRVRFYPNGVSDEFKMLLFRPDTNERRLITVEVTTALVDVESDLMKMKTR